MTPTLYYYIPLPFTTQTQCPCSLVGCIQSLRSGGGWFDLQLGQHSLQGLMKVTVTGLIPLTLLSIILMIIMWESNHWLGNKNSRKAWLDELAVTI